MRFLNVSAVIAILLVCLAGLARAETHLIDYTIAEPGNVSLIVTDTNGRVVRELLHAAPTEPGRHQLVWDGLDADGVGVAAGTYQWKLLQTPGLRARYLLSLGSNYPPGDTWRTASAPGTHSAPGGIAVDDSGIYISARTTENIETCMLKLSPDGQTRLWSALHPRAWDGALSLAVDRDNLYMLGRVTKGDGRIGPDKRRKQLVYIYEAATGRLAPRSMAPSAVGPVPIMIDVQWDPDSDASDATDMDARDGVLVVAYARQDALRWYDPQSGKLLRTLQIAAPGGVALGASGDLYISSGEAVWRLAPEAEEPVQLAGGLAGPGRLSVDTSSGELLVYLAGTQQIQRFSATGEPLRTYGEAGGRQPGLYDDAAKRSFAGFGDLAADGQGGFYVTEPGAAPRRTAHMAADGSVIREWYGGQRWAPHAAPEPGNPNVLWVGSQYGWAMRVIADYEAGTWEVHSTYQYSNLADKLVGDSWNEGGYFRILTHQGSTYFVLEKMPTILRLDEERWQLMPVTITGNTNRSTDAVKEWAGNHASFQWNDANGDGLPQQDEFTFYTHGLGARFQPVIGDDFTAWFVSIDGERFTVRKAGVERWNEIGAPIYGQLPGGVDFAPVPTRFSPKVHQDTRWASYLHHDASTGDLFGVFNPWTSNWCQSDDSFIQRWGADGQARWTVGRQGGYGTSVPGEIHRNPRGIAGIAHDCLVVIDVDGGWNMKNLAVSYVWDRNGLFVGGLMDNPDLDGIADYWYQGSGEFCHSSLVTLPDGDLLFIGNWENEMRVWRISGWQGWQRQQGALTVQTPSADQQGTGLTAHYFQGTDFAQPVTVRVDPKIDVDFGLTPPPGTGLEAADAYGVRWRGRVMPAYGPAYHGPWSTRRAATAHDRELRGARDGGASVTLRFRGSSVSLLGQTGPNCGFARIYLNDELVQEQVDCYSEKVEAGVQLYAVDNLPAGDHELKVVVDGWRARRNPKASDSWIMLDAFVVDGETIDAGGMLHQVALRTSAKAQLWVNRQARLSVDGEAAATGIKLLRELSDLQVDFHKTTESGAITLAWSSPFEPEAPIATTALFPVTRGTPQQGDK